MKIGNFEIGSAPFLIAEASINHNGSMERAIEMIGVAKDAGADAIKFQTFSANDVCDPTQMYTYQSQGKTVTEPRINIFLRSEFPETVWPILKAECDRVGIMFMSTPETPADLDILLKVGIPAIKIGSDNLTNLPMLRYCARDDVGLPVILSCGMSDIGELQRAVWIFDNNGAQKCPLAIMVCTSEYPCLPESTNLARIAFLRSEINKIPIGFSDHTIGSFSASVAVGAGACIFETHFTLDNELPGPEHWWAKNPVGLNRWCTDIREAWDMMGSGEIKPSAAELENKRQYQRRHT